MGERIELSNQRDGSRGLPTSAHWPGSRARYRIIAETCRYDTSAADPIYRARSRTCLRATHLRSIARDYPPLDRVARGDEATREGARAAERVLINAKRVTPTSYENRNGPWCNW